MSLLTDVQTAVNTFVAKVAVLVTQTGYLLGVITGPPTGASSIVDVGPRTLKTLARIELEIQAGQAFNPRGVWSAVTTYAQLDAVSSGTVAYVSIQNANLNHDPASSPLFWMQLITADQSVTVSGSAPSSPFNGKLWYDPSLSPYPGLFMWETDADSSQWIEL
jgi:hypothetical protein